MTTMFFVFVFFLFFYKALDTQDFEQLTISIGLHTDYDYKSYGHKWDGLQIIAQIIRRRYEKAEGTILAVSIIS